MLIIALVILVILVVIWLTTVISSSTAATISATISTTSVVAFVRIVVFSIGGVRHESFCFFGFSFGCLCYESLGLPASADGAFTLGEQSEGLVEING